MYSEVHRKQFSDIKNNLKGLKCTRPNCVLFLIIYVILPKIKPRSLSQEKDHDAKKREKNMSLDLQVTEDAKVNGVEGSYQVFRWSERFARAVTWFSDLEEAENVDDTQRKLRMTETTGMRGRECVEVKRFKFSLRILRHFSFFFSFHFCFMAFKLFKI